MCSSFCSRVTSVLSSANEEVLLLGQVSQALPEAELLLSAGRLSPSTSFQEFYRSERSALGPFFLLPDSLELWAEEQQRSLLAVQEQTNSFLSRRTDG